MAMPSNAAPATSKKTDRLTSPNGDNRARCGRLFVAATAVISGGLAGTPIT